MNRTHALIAAGIVGAAMSEPAAAFQFENGTIWPLAVGINGGPTALVPPEQVAFLHRGQCNAGCEVNITINDPSRPQTALNLAGGEVPAIAGNGDQAIVRVRQDRGGITVEIVGGEATAVAPGTPTAQPPALQTPTVETPTVQAPALQAPPSQTPTVQAPAVETPAPQTPAVQAPTPPASSSGGTAPGSTTIIPPPPAPDYSAN